MKILHVVNVSFVIPYFLGNQINYFKKNGHDIFIVCSDSKELKHLSKKYNFKYEVINITRQLNPFTDIISFFKLYKYIFKNKFDVVIGHTPKAAMFAMLASFLSFVPRRIYIRHGIMFETSYGLKKNIYKLVEQFTSFFSSSIICVSKSVFDSSIQMKLSTRNKTLLIHHGSCNGVDSSYKFNPFRSNNTILLDLKMKYNIKKKDFVIGFIGRIVQDKGIILLLNAWDILKERHDNLKLLLIGPLEKRDGIDKIYQNKIYSDEDILYLGLIEDTNVYYSLMNVLVLPSYREGFPTVVLEASAMQLPVITSKKTGCIDSIVENETGIFCDLNPQSIANCIEQYIFNNNLSNIHGQNGRRFVVQNFDQQLIWEKLKILYCNEN
jgi:glycosyltransferase involved in cell wall biosynthesis